MRALHPQSGGAGGLRLGRGALDKAAHGRGPPPPRLNTRRPLIGILRKISFGLAIFTSPGGAQL